MSNLFQRISELLPALHGWCSESKAHTLAAAVLALRPETTVEIGIYGGRSFLPMALAHKEIGRGMIIGIDPWHPHESAKGQINESDHKFWSENLPPGQHASHDRVMNHFLQKLHELGVQNCVNIIRLPSDAVEPPTKIDLLHLDGNHSDQAVRDVERFAPKCRVGALMFVDDIHWSGGGVARAVEKLKATGWAFLYALDTGAVFQRT